MSSIGFTSIFMSDVRILHLRDLLQKVGNGIGCQR